MFFKRQSIQKKMMLSCLAVTLIPLLILEVIFACMMQKQTYNDVVSSAAAFASTAIPGAEMESSLTIRIFIRKLLICMYSKASRPVFWAGMRKSVA